jgi:hypothetical protein
MMPSADSRIGPEHPRTVDKKTAKCVESKHIIISSKIYLFTN